MVQSAQKRICPKHFVQVMEPLPTYQSLPFNMLWYFQAFGSIKIVNVLFRFFLLLGKRKSLRDADQDAPKCCPLQYLDTKICLA